MSNESKGIAARVALFSFGLFIVVLSLIFFYPYNPDNQQVALFTSISLIALYVVLATPLLFGPRIERLTTGRLISLGFIWAAALPFALVSITSIVCANTLEPEYFKWCIIGELIAFFLLAMSLVVGWSTANYADEVEAEQAAQRASIDDLRRLAAELPMLARHLDVPQGVSTDELVSNLEQVSEELRYTAPSTVPEAASVEYELFGLLGGIRSELSLGSMNAGRLDALVRSSLQASHLVERRRAIRN